MHYLGIEAALKNQPLLDPAFIPFGVWRREYEKEASRPFALAVERDHGAVSVFETKLRGEDFAEANYRYIERFVKLLLWSAGGLRVWLCGDDALAKRLQAEYCPEGRRAFDVGFMQDVFEVPFEIVICDWAHLPKPNEKPIRVGGHTNGCRIGFDAGGSDRKVSAVIDGQTVYSEEVVWFPKINSDPDYHYEGIVAALKSAAEHMPRVDAVGVSSPGELELVRLHLPDHLELAAFGEVGFAHILKHLIIAVNQPQRHAPNLGTGRDTDFRSRTRRTEAPEQQRARQHDFGITRLRGIEREPDFSVLRGTGHFFAAARFRNDQSSAVDGNRRGRKDAACADRDEKGQLLQTIHGYLKRSLRTYQRINRNIPACSVNSSVRP